MHGLLHVYRAAILSLGGKCTRISVNTVTLLFIITELKTGLKVEL